MYRELREARLAAPRRADGRAAAAAAQQDDGPGDAQIVLADLSMSLDNVLAVAGWRAPNPRPGCSSLGLVLSVALMGVASTYIARLLDALFWLSWVGLGIVAFVALRMIWDGSAQILHHSAALGLGSS